MDGIKGRYSSYVNIQDTDEKLVETDVTGPDSSQNIRIKSEIICFHNSKFEEIRRLDGISNEDIK